MIASISITPAAPSVAAGTSLQLTATAIFTDMTTSDVTSTATWSSAAAATATVSATGLLTGVAVGNATISARVGGVTGTTNATVTAAVLRSIAVTPSTPSLAVGIKQQLTATGTFSDNTTQNLTAQVTWTTSEDQRATVSAAGEVTAVGVGTATIAATRGGITGSTMVTVTAAQLVSIAITPPTPSVARGRTLALVATGTFTDSTTQNLTTQVTWASGTLATATIETGGANAGLVTSVDPGTTTITATLGAIIGTTLLTVTAAELVSIAVTPPTPSIALGRTQQFTATGTFTDNTTQNLTTQVTWTSGNEAVAVISNAAGSEGLATSVTVGTARITATLGAISGSADLTVTAAELVSIAVEPVNPSVALGRTQQFQAIGTFSDLSTQNLTADVTWASTDETVATISNADGEEGLATTHAVGTTKISATLGIITGSTDLTVTAAVLVAIGVTPPTASVALGRTQQFEATGTFSDNTTQDITDQVTWASSDEAIATISNADGEEGLASTVGVGTATISATLDGVTGNATLTVTAAVLDSIAVTPVNPSVALGRLQQFQAIGTFSNQTVQDLTADVLWASTDETVATISNADGEEGLATTHAVGTTTISATLDGITGSTVLTVTAAVLESIDVTPANPSVALGRTQEFTATGTFSDDTTQDITAEVTWTSGNEAVATISNLEETKGLASTHSVGTAAIRATLDGITGVTTLTVTAAVLVRIEVTPINPSAARGTEVQFTATGVFTNGTQDLTTQVTWASTDPTVASISNEADSKGLAVALNVGTTTISATLDGIVGITILTVTDAVLVSIEVQPAAPSLPVGLELQFQAIGTFSDLSTQNLTALATWASTDEAVALISNADGTEGLATGIAVGTTEISATFGGITGVTTLTVSPAILLAITVTPSPVSIALGRSQQFTATGLFSDGSAPDLTTQVTWQSSDPTVAVVSNADGSRGLAVSLALGVTTISATLDGVTGLAALTVTAAELEAITVAPATATVVEGLSQAFTATGLFSDSTELDLTTQVLWASSDEAVAQISNADGSQGVATAIAAGTTTISATLGGITGTATLVVTAAVLDSIEVTPATARVVPGGKQQYTAIGTFNNGDTADLTTTVLWATGDLAIAAISNIDGTRGEATGLAVGTTAITATLGLVTGTAELVVLAPSVTATVPPDGAIDVTTSTTIVVTFNQPIAAASLTTQTTAGPCSGSLQLSADDFATCEAFTAQPTLSAGGTIGTARPALLQVSTTYRIRVLATVTNLAGAPMDADFTQAIGFTTAAACEARFVISQIYGGGGNAGSVFRNDFIELHNIGGTPLDLSGFAVQFISAAGSGTWAAQSLPSVIVPPGGYFLIQESQGAQQTAPLPAPDFIPGNPFLMGATSGKIAITPITTALTGACPLNLTSDLLGYGTGLSCAEGTGALAPANPTGLLRNNGGCDDTDDNRADFTVLTPAPRNGATAPRVCSCPSN